MQITKRTPVINKLKTNVHMVQQNTSREKVHLWKVRLVRVRLAKRGKHKS